MYIKNKNNYFYVKSLKYLISIWNPNVSVYTVIVTQIFTKENASPGFSFCLLIPLFTKSITVNTCQTLKEEWEKKQKIA